MNKCIVDVIKMNHYSYFLLFFLKKLFLNDSSNGWLFSYFKYKLKYS